MGDMKDHIHDKVVNFSYDHISFSIQNNFRMNFSSTNFNIQTACDTLLKLQAHLSCETILKPSPPAALMLYSDA